jgi:hypothetical protein
MTDAIEAHHACIEAEAIFLAAERACAEARADLLEAEANAHAAHDELVAAVENMNATCAVAEEMAQLVTLARQVAQDADTPGWYSTPDM